MAYGNRCVANKFRRCSSAATAQSSLSTAGKKERERKREIVSEQVSLVCSRATQPGEKSTEKSCERSVCQLKAYNSPQTTSEQTSSNSNNEQQQLRTTETCTTRIWAKDKAASNRCGLPVTRTEIAARKCRAKAAAWPGGREREAVRVVHGALVTQVTCCQKAKRQNTRYKQRRTIR